MSLQQGVRTFFCRFSVNASAKMDGPIIQLKMSAAPGERMLPVEYNPAATGDRDSKLTIYDRTGEKKLSVSIFISKSVRPTRGLW